MGATTPASNRYAAAVSKLEPPAAAPLEVLPEQADDPAYWARVEADPEAYARLLLANDDALAYAAMSDDLLARLAVDHEPFIGTCAFAELKGRESDRVPAVAEQILHDHFDGWLKASALDSVSTDRKYEHMHRLLALAEPCDLGKAFLLGQMLEQVLQPPEGDRANHGIVEQLLRERLAAEPESVREEVRIHLSHLELAAPAWL